jgi:hypothetical protein
MNNTVSVSVYIAANNWMTMCNELEQDVKYKTIILSVVLYGCKTWSLTFTEEYRLRVFEYRMLRTIFGPKRDEVTGG